MGAIIIWAIVVVLAFLWRHKIIQAVIAFFTVGLLFFLFAYMADNFSSVNLRGFFPSFMYAYDETLDDPKGKAQELVDGAKKGANKAVDTVNEAGEVIDDRLGTQKETKSTTDSSLSEAELQAEQGENTVYWGNGVTSDKQQREDQSEESEDKNSSKDVGNRPAFVAFKDVKTAVKGDLAWLSDADKDLLVNMSPYVKKKIKGDQVTLQVGKQKEEQGIKISYIN